MSDQTTPAPDSDPTAAIPPAIPPVIPPVEGYQPPPVYPAPVEPPATWPATEPAAAYPVPVPPPAAPMPMGQTSSNAIVALILAVVSWAVCPIIPAIVALVLAASAAKEIAGSGGRIQGQGLVTAARIVSWVNIGVWAAGLVIGAFFLVLALVAGGLDSANSL
jgi:hypothetical protein